MSKDVDNRCTMPFTGISELALYNGTVATCCKTPYVPLDPVNGVLTKELIELRTSIIKNERNEQCKSCWEIDDDGGPSQRRRNSHHFTNPLDWDNLDPYQPVRHIGVAFSNKCQLMCVYCSPTVSSMWEASQEQFSAFKAPALKVETPPNIKDVVDTDNLLSIHISGGEPMLEPACTSFLLDLPFRHDRKIGIVTNLSYGTATFGVLQQIIKRHPNIGISCSLDAIGENSSRKYFNWEMWERNFQELAKTWLPRFRIFPNAYLHINITVSVLNYKNIQEIIDYIISFKRKDIPIKFDINPVGSFEFASLASIEVDRSVKIEIKDSDIRLFNERELEIIRNFNNLIQQSVHNKSLEKPTKIFLIKYLAK